MAISATASDMRVRSVQVGGERLTVDLLDGRSIPAPLAWYPRLWEATPAQRQNIVLAEGGYGLHAPDVDEDLSTGDLLWDAPAPALQR